jgi:trehalose 6-phosphate phosphatase
MTPPSLDLARSALSATPAGVLTDFDGTLSAIVRDPEAARPLPGAIPALEALAGQGVLVGVVSGRAAADVRRRLGSDRLLVIGNHGLEWLEPGAAAAGARVSPVVQAAVDRAAAAVPREPGVEVEHKGLSATVHVRRAPDPLAARERVRAALERAAPPGVVLRPGRMSLEIRPAGAGDKGTATRDVVERHGLRGLLVLGDDVTDLDMFRAAAALRAEAGLRATILGVGAGGEAPPEVAAAADALLPDPESVVKLLAALAAPSARP